MSNFASMLAALREQNGYTQEQVAAGVGVGKSTISMYERNNRRPDYDILEKLADFFKVDIDTLIGRPRPASKREELALPEGLNIGGLFEMLDNKPKLGILLACCKDLDESNLDILLALVQTMRHPGE